jgi:formylglycine-generating enzyme required for sulfatase activity
MTAAAALAALGSLVPGAASLVAEPPSMVSIPAGSYLPLYGGAKPSSPLVRVDAFVMDVHPVTNGEYLAFLRTHPEWRRSRVAPLFADAGYLRHWAGELELGPVAPASSPVVNVSWFAARAYLAAQGKRLPTVDEWEYAARASNRERDASADPRFKALVLAWAGRPLPSPLPAVQQAAPNVYGVKGLHDLVREWTEDFNSVLGTGESRADGSLDRSLFCGSGAMGAADFTDYAAFTRFALRGSLQAHYTAGHLGFRGVKSQAPRRDQGGRR